MLGAALVVCGIGLVWSFLDLQQEPATPKARQRKLMAVHLLLIAMGVWLLIKANSSTSLICIVFSTAILLLMRLATLRTKVARHLGAWTFLFLFVIVPLNALFNIGELFVGSMGRDLTFTGRTEIWQRCLASDINPLVGVGYYSLWNGPRAEKVSEGFFYQLNEAHSGFIETYLNSGIVGLFLLGAVLLMTGKKIRTKLERGGSYQALRLGFLVVVIFYNITEAAFNRLTAIWFVALLLLLEYPLSRRQPAGAQAQPARESAAVPGSDPVFPGPPTAGSAASV
jgi:O-antigen ligase